jgi:glycyl-tRNA synthetase beta chain
MPDLLIEIGTEELPAGACREVIDQVPGIARDAVSDLRLASGESTVWVSPRRYATLIPGLPDERPGRSRSVRGPAASAAFDDDGAPTKAGEGFARGQGVAVDRLQVREQDGREFVFVDIDEPATPTVELVADIAERLIAGVRFSKTMRWGDGTGLRFSRPVRWIVAKLGEQTVAFERFGLTAGATSQGHRFLGRPVEIASPATYRDQLREVGVVVDHEERRRTIVEGLDAAAADRTCSWSDPGGKLEEVVFLVEWPSPLTGQINPEHLTMPERVLVTAMQSHQRYFPLADSDGSLHPAFLAVQNGDPAHAEVIAAGNQGVLEARLQDAAFSFAKDRDAGLAELDRRLDTIVFHQRLGTMADKRERLVAGVGALAEAVGADPDDAAHAEQAARLAKVDQGAVLVAEFSDLEGYVAAQYAREEGYPEEVTRAIADQFLPAGPSTPLPETAPGALLALAEKVDNLVGAFLVDEAPTGSKDPYGLRRAAQGAVRIMVANGWDVPTRPMLRGGAATLRSQGADLVLDDPEALDRLEAFLADRVAYQLGEEGVPAEVCAAAAGAGLGSVAATVAWARALAERRADDDFAAARTAHTRLVKLSADFDEDLPPFASAGDAGEDALAAALDVAEPAIASAREQRSAEAALSASAPLAEAVDRFLTDVMVNAEDAAARARRQALVVRSAEAIGRVADFTQIGGAD